MTGVVGAAVDSIVTYHKVHTTHTYLHAVGSFRKRLRLPVGESKS